MIAARFVVSGHVHGVFFRDATRRVARRLGLAGWVRNAWDGTVEVFAQGDAEALDELAAFLADGPPHAMVTGVERRQATADPQVRDFDIRH